MTLRAAFWLWLASSFFSVAFAQNLFQKIPPSVQRGMEAYQNERFEEADAAFAQAQTHMPSNAQLEFNRGTTFFKQEKYNEALQSLSRALEWDEGKLRGDVFYNMGNTYAAMGNTADAIASYRQALRANPQDEMARHNLEFLLSLPPPPPPPEDSPTSPKEDEKPSDASSSSDTPSPSPQQQTQDNPDTSTSADKKNPARENQESAPPTPGDAKDSPAPKHNDVNEETSEKNAPQEGASQRPTGRLRKEDADKILDAFGMDEKSYEPWRFQKKPPVEEWQYEQDW